MYNFFTKSKAITLAVNFLIILLLILPPIGQALAMGADHQAALNLVNLSSVNRSVVKSGSWSDPTTWSGGTLPKAGENLHVPQGKTLLVDVVSDTSLDTVRVDGVIKFATNNNVRIKLDTLVVTQTGTFEIGAENNRVEQAKKVEIIIAQNGVINRSWDPTNISRGIILQGKTRIYGAEKSAYHTLSIDPAAGSTQITLNSIPTGWAKGDIIAITAAKFRPKRNADLQFQTEDELRRIKAISGNSIILGALIDPDTLAPLGRNHIPSIEKMPVYVANLTRNVVFRSEGGNLVPANQRGHFVVMHNPDAVVKGAGFYFFGRTNKSIPLDDFLLDAHGFRKTDANGNYIPGPSNNPRGRYAVHFHHTGVANINATPVICSGNAVMFSPGWGFVNHTSHVIMENNASFDVYGSHFVSEDGNELGAFRKNIAIKSQGLNATVKKGTGNHDGGHTGHGFWLESRNMVMEDNVISGVNNAGVIYFNRNPISDINLHIPAHNLLIANKNILKALPTIGAAHIPITHEKNTTVVSSGFALVVVKANNNQNHDARNMIESLKGYSVRNGVQIQYSNKYTLKDVELVAAPSSTKWNEGINVTTGVPEIAVINAKVDGFIHPVVTGTFFQGKASPTKATFANVLIDGKPINPALNIHKPESDILSNYDPQIHKVLNLDTTKIQPSLSFLPSSTNSYDLPKNLGVGFLLKGIKTDSIGSIAFESQWWRPNLQNTVAKGYYTRQDGSKFIVIKDVIADRMTGENKTITIRMNIKYEYSFLGPNLGLLVH
jgi:G8 domain